jgi:hypothetical protein
MRRIIMTLAVLALSMSTAFGGLDYFAIQNGGSTSIRIFSYDTVAKTVALVDTVTTTASGSGHVKVVSAGSDLSFWAGVSSGASDGVERFTGDGSSWANNVYVKMNAETAAGEYYDTSVASRVGLNTDTVGPGAAELDDGTIFVAEAREDTYAMGDITGQSGTVTAVFTADALHMGDLDSTLGGLSASRPADVASTIAGSANRFVTTGGLGDFDVMVYNADGTFKGDLTNLAGGGRSGVGSMKVSGSGDVILQIASDRSTNPIIKINGRSVTEGAAFDSIVISEFSIVKPAGDYFVEAYDVDGTQSGLIMVVGEVRRSGDSPGVWFFDTSGNPTTTNPFYLKDLDASLSDVDTRGAGLFEAAALPVAEPAGVGIAGLALLGLRRRRS